MRGGIPLRLREYGFNFVLVERGKKKPIGLAWNKRVYKLDNSNLNKQLEDGGNGGIQPNFSKIVINSIEHELLMVDFDKKWLQDKVLDKFPKTFTTTSGSSKNCLHLWFASDKADQLAIKDEEGNTLADIIGNDGYIMCPPSIHPSGSVYSVVEDVPIVFFPYDKILEILKPFDKTLPKKIKEVTPRKDYGTNSFYDMVRSRINVIDVLNEQGIDTSKSPTNCPFHDSVSGECLSFDSEKWFCHHGGCGKSGNLFILVRDLKNLTARETFEELAEKTNLTDELKKFQSDYLKEKEAQVNG